MCVNATAAVAVFHGDIEGTFAGAQLNTTECAPVCIVSTSQSKTFVKERLKNSIGCVGVLVKTI